MALTLKGKSTYHWIVGKQDDLYWIIGSAGAGLFLLAVYFLLTQVLPQLSGIVISSSVVIAVIFLIWTFFFDSTHFFATYSRTFLDTQYRQENKTMLYSSLLIFLLGPSYLIAPTFLTSSLFLSSPENQQAYSYAIFALIIFGSILWGYFHLIRQHWGFIALYQKKNNEMNAFQHKLDATVLFIGSLWPFLFYLKENLLAQSPFVELIATLQNNHFIYCLFYLSGFSLFIGTTLKWKLSIKELGDLLLLIGFILIALSCWALLNVNISIENALSDFEYLFRFLLIASLLIYSAYYLLFNRHWNIPKFLLMGSVLITHNIVLLSVSDFLLISACLTIFHNIQYHKIVRYFNLNHYRAALSEETALSGETALSEEKAQINAHGFAVALTQNLSYFILFALLFSLLVFFLRGSVTLAESGLVKMVLITSLINGISLHHYFLDGIIWRTSKDKTLSASLHLPH